MRFGIVGLGRMGSNLARRAIKRGHEVVGFDQNIELVQSLAAEGIDPAHSLSGLLVKLPAPRIVFLYVPHGGPTELVCQELREPFFRGDIVVDGGNSHWLDSVRHHEFFAEAGVRFLDVGTSGGVQGAREGACFMVGGDHDAFVVVRPVLNDLAVDEEAVFYAGPPGSGHFVKLVHNAIEFGMVQAIAEGVELLKRSDYQPNLVGLFHNWMHGSVIRSWLVELMGKALAENPDFAELSTYVEDTGEVKWVLKWAMDNDIPAPVMSSSQMALLEHRDVRSPTAISVALLRNQYGGHPVHSISRNGRQ